MTRNLYHAHRLPSSSDKIRGIIKDKEKVNGKKKKKNSDPCISVVKTPCTTKDTQWPQKNKIHEITRSWQQNRVEYIPTHRKRRIGGKKEENRTNESMTGPWTLQRD
jgi:hypothetical protein